MVESVAGGADLLGILRGAEIFAGADPRQVEEWIARAELVQVPAGQALFRQGDAADSLYVVLTGVLEVSVTDRRGERTIVGERGPGSPLGEIAILTGGRRGASVQASQDSVLAMLRAVDARALFARHPDVKLRFLDTARARLRMTQCVEILKRYFGEVDGTLLGFLESHLEWVHLKRGETLFRKGDAGDSLYFLVHGLLSIVDTEPSGEQEGIGLVYRGETVGEMSLLTGEDRAASVCALRDSDLARLTNASCRQISAGHPAVTSAIARVLVDRLKHRGGGAGRRGAVNVVLAPVSEGVPLPELCQRLHAALGRLERATLINSRSVAAEFSGQAITDDGDPRGLELAAWLEEQESAASIVLYEADARPTSWTRRCLERADQVFLVAIADEKPAPGAAAADDPITALGGSPGKRRLVLLHGDGDVLPTGTAGWLEALRPTSHHHVRWRNDADISRLARLACGRSVGVVLGGGGAKGLAHLGALRAIEEAGIPIDMIGGASMGSIVAGVHALGWDFARMLRASREMLVKQKLFRELTLPLVSLVRSRKVDRLLRSLYGDCRIEDLWESFFCTSSNLNTCTLKVHRSGTLWKAIRTSCSLPVIMPPIPYEGEVHLDGGVLNSLPCDIMRDEAGFVLAVDVDTQGRMIVESDPYPSPWKLLWDRIRRRGPSGRTPNIVDITLASFRASNRKHVVQAKEQADLCIEPLLGGVGILAFSRLEEIVQIGYDCARATLAGLPADSPIRALRGQA